MLVSTWLAAPGRPFFVYFFEGVVALMYSSPFMLTFIDCFLREQSFLLLKW